MNKIIFLRKKTIFFLPEKGNSVEEQFNSCLVDLTEKLADLNIDFRNILKQSIFLKAKDYERFLGKKEILQGILEKYFSNNIPPTSMLSQTPANGTEVAMEVTVALNN